jgi:hypothetical protein
MSGNKIFVLMYHRHKLLDNNIYSSVAASQLRLVHKVILPLAVKDQDL